MDSVNHQHVGGLSPNIAFVETAGAHAVGRILYRVRGPMFCLVFKGLYWLLTGEIPLDDDNIGVRALSTRCPGTLKRKSKQSTSSLGLAG